WILDWGRIRTTVSLTPAFQIQNPKSAIQNTQQAGVPAASRDAGTAQTSTVMAKRGKRFKAAVAAVKEAGGPFALEQAADLVKRTASAKFDESVDIDMRLGVDPRHADQMVRGSVALPHGTGKTV